MKNYVVILMIVISSNLIYGQSSNIITQILSQDSISISLYSKPKQLALENCQALEIFEYTISQDKGYLMISNYGCFGKEIIGYLPGQIKPFISFIYANGITNELSAVKEFFISSLALKNISALEEDFNLKFKWSISEGVQLNKLELNTSNFPVFGK